MLPMFLLWIQCFVQEHSRSPLSQTRNLLRCNHLNRSSSLLQKSYSWKTSLCNFSLIRSYAFRHLLCSRCQIQIMDFQNLLPAFCNFWVYMFVNNLWYSRFQQDIGCPIYPRRTLHLIIRRTIQFLSLCQGPKW